MTLSSTGPWAIRAATQFLSAQPGPKHWGGHRQCWLLWGTKAQFPCLKADIHNVAIYTFELPMGLSWEWLHLKPHPHLAFPPARPCCPYSLTRFSHEHCTNKEIRQEFSFLALLLGNLTPHSFTASISPSSNPKAPLYVYSILLEKLDVWLQLTENLISSGLNQQGFVYFLKQFLPQCDNCQLSDRFLGRTIR